MNISDVNTNPTHRADLLRNNGIGDSGQIDPSSKKASSATSQEVGDRVEISDKARAALKDARKSEELNFARQALDNVPSLSEERMAELTERIKSGYYQQPSVLDQIAKRAGGELAAGA